jgi:hypothetical protein
MADPFTWAAIGIGSSIASGAVGAYGALQKGAADSAMYGYQASVARMNQQIALQNAGYAQVAGGSAALQEGQKVAANRSAIRVAQSASGIDMNTGSARQVQVDQAKLGVQDQNIIRENYARKAYAYESEAASKGAEAVGDMAAADQASKAGTINAFSSILGAAGSVSGKWLQGNSSFGWSTA